MGISCSAAVIGLYRFRANSAPLAFQSNRRYELRANDTTQHTANPSQMMPLRCRSTSATNAGQANTTNDVAYLSPREGSAKWNANAIAAHRTTKKATSTVGQRLSYMASRRRFTTSGRMRSANKKNNA